MHTVVLLAHALNLTERLGYEVRQEWLDGHSGGHCLLRGRKILFLDISLSPQEQMELVLNVLHSEPRASELEMPAELRSMLRKRDVA